MVFLVADDNAAVRKMIKGILAAPQHSFIECCNGKEAVNNYARYKPDWVIMDIEMKPLDGIAATRQIIQKFPKANIVILSQYNDAHLKKAALEAKAKYYFLKEDMTRLAGFFEDKFVK